MALQIGDTVGDYEIVGVLGKGGMGKVYRVRNLLSDRIEAMKVVLPDLSADPGLADRFLREIRVHASLEHPNIAALRTALRVDNQVLMVMELVEGISLEERLRQGPLDLASGIRYVDQILSALDLAHSRGIIHRDIKPANVIVTPDGDREADRFRHRALRLRRQPDTERRGAGLALLHVAGTGAGPAGGSALRHLRRSESPSTRW